MKAKENIENEFSLTPIFTVTDLFTRSADEPTGEVIIDKVVKVLREKPVIWPEEVAEVLGVSRNHLSGAIMLLTGVSLDKMIREWRLLQAMLLIRTTDKDFDEIARLCGYSQTKTLTQAMESHLHMSPYEYRNGCHREQIRRYRRSHPNG